MEYNDLSCPYNQAIWSDISSKSGSNEVLIYAPYMLFASQNGLEVCLDEDIRNYWKSIKITNECIEFCAMVKATFTLDKEELECFISEENYRKDMHYSKSIIKKWAEKVVVYLIDAEFCSVLNKDTKVMELIKSQMDTIEALFRFCICN
jgi:hypothetical protein